MANLLRSPALNQINTASGNPLDESPSAGVGISDPPDFLFRFRGELLKEDWGMEIRPLNDIDGPARMVTRDSRSVLRWMTSKQLLDLGMNQVVYLKSGICEGKMLFVLFGADGTPVIAADNVDAAVETAIEQGLSFVAMH
jgi:hypothetical protein